MTKPIFEVITGGKGTTTAIPEGKKLYALVLSSDPYTFQTLDGGSHVDVPAYTIPELSDPTHPALIYANNEEEAKSIYVKFVAEFVGEEEAPLVMQRLADIIVLGEVLDVKTTSQDALIPGINDYELTIVQKIRVMGEQFVNDPPSDWF
ncbi:hypothetical protein [Paenibacillus sp. S-12]|uniref:hypothetical protein n=1 Tax=Paenibacillus sp. S-12 TaxID=3031371 RepID=UPI0025A1F8AC|nr:hypothetical protein [Paenibacillus sp. S-12]